MTQSFDKGSGYCTTFHDFAFREESQVFTVRQYLGKSSQHRHLPPFLHGKHSSVRTLSTRTTVDRPGLSQLPENPGDKRPLAAIPFL